jgi:diguanylate cyclase (GGDEF)-like protein
MDRRPAAHRRFAFAAAAIMVIAAIVRVLTLPLSSGVLAIEAGVGAVVLLYFGVAFKLMTFDWTRRSYLLVLYALAPALVAGFGLGLAAPKIPDFTMIAALVYASIMLSIDVGASRMAVGLAGFGVIAVFVELWLATVPITQAEIGSLIIAVAFLVGLQLLCLAHAERAKVQMDAEAESSRAFLTVARRVGTARDVTSVASAVLSASREVFPGATHGELLVLDEADGQLKSTGVSLEPQGVIATAGVIEVSPGEGLAGTVLAVGRAVVWPSALDVSMAQSNLREATRVRLRETAAAYARSAIGAPLRPPDSGVVGVLVLTSRRREELFSEDDLRAMQALADAAARALDLARRYEADLDQALLDSVTGLVSHRQLVATLDKEVSRAARADETVAAIFSDLDEFKEINDIWGHETGNRVLAMYADVLRGTLRREDTAARFGGDEFVCILPGADRSQAAAVAGRIRQRFATLAAEDRVIGASRASVSSGIAVFPDDADTADGLLNAADAELLRAKQARTRSLAGRGRGRLTRGAEDALHLTTTGE